MYAHHVIESLDNLIKNNINNIKTNDKLFYYHSNRLKESIKNSMQFNISDCEGVYEMFKNNIGCRLFNNVNSKYQKMPYKKIWLDWERKDDQEIESGDVKILKRGIFVEELYDNIIVAYIFNHPTGGRFINKTWWIPPIYGIVYSIGCSLNKNKNYQELLNGFGVNVENWSDGNAMPFHLSEKLKSMNFNYEKLIGEDNGDFSLLDSFLTLLNCKNISIQKNYPPKNLNKKRVNKGKQPLFTYHTLVIDNVGEKNRLNTEHKPTGIKQRIHFCRGHFKEYTESNKLFGKHTGLYWWQPIVRGNKELGLVHKDYEVRASVNA